MKAAAPLGLLLVVGCDGLDEKAAIDENARQNIGRAELYRLEHPSDRYQIAPGANGEVWVIDAQRAILQRCQPSPVTELGIICGPRSVAQLDD